MEITAAVILKILLFAYVTGVVTRVARFNFNKWRRNRLKRMGNPVAERALGESLVEETLELSTGEQTPHED